MMARLKYKVSLPTGETIWLTGNTISEAFSNGLLRYGHQFGEPPKTNQSPTIRTFIETIYYPTFITPLAPTTKESYEQYLRLNILPFMGDMPMNEITVTTIQAFYDWMATASQRGRKKNLNRKTIERVGGLVGKVFRVAMDMDIVSQSPIKKTLLRNNGANASHHKALSYEEIDRVKKSIPALPVERQRLYMALLAYTGMRPEEILGLCWENVHLEDGYCEMVRTVTYPKNAGTMIREGGKTELSVRTIALPDPAINILSSATNRTGYILYGETRDRPLAYSTYKRTYQAAFKALGITCCNYDFRTTYGTQLCEAGLTTKQVADMMGHSTTRMVETVYARSRHAGIMRQRDFLNHLNEPYELTEKLTPKEGSTPYNATVSEDAR